MARLTAKARRKLPSSAFVYPKVRKYPIDTPRRARAALRLSAKKTTYGTYGKVAAKVRKKYPSINVGGKR